jgi:PAS domain S-box-containing protein
VVDVASPKEGAWPWRCALDPCGAIEVVSAEAVLDAPEHCAAAIFIVVASVADPVAVARSLAQHHATADIVLLLPADRLVAVAARLRQAPIPGGRTQVLDPEAPATLAALERTCDRAEQRTRFRTTIERANRLMGATVAARPKATVATERLLGGILAAARDPIVAVDRDGAVVVWNPAAERTFGRCAAEAYDRPLAAALRGLEPLAPVLTMVARGQSGELVCSRATADGAMRTVSVVVNPLPDSSGGAAIMLYDVTERMQRDAEVRKHSADLSRSNRDLEQFAYIAAHDLQEPLRVILVYSDALQRRHGSRLDEAAERLLLHLRAAAERMRVLIKGVLTYSLIGAQGAARAEDRVAVDLAAATAEALANLSVAIAEQGASVELGPLPPVLGDHPLLVQLLQNLIGNALKFQAPGRCPRIEVAAQRDGPDWMISVSDNGIGIAPEHLAKLFKIFQRLHTRAEFPGHGIGLATCRRIVEHLGGRIWVESREGAGATFQFTLPALA